MAHMKELLKYVTEAESNVSKINLRFLKDQKNKLAIFTLVLER